MGKTRGPSGQANAIYCYDSHQWPDTISQPHARTKQLGLLLPRTHTEKERKKERKKERGVAIYYDRRDAVQYTY